MIGKTLNGAAFALALIAFSPALAQNADAPVDVTAAPPPSAETVGPSQLRDFTLNGTVTRAADRPAVSTAAPAPSPSQPAVGLPSAPGPLGVRAAEARRPAESSPSAAVPDPGPGIRNAVKSPDVTKLVSPSTPSSVATESAPASSFAPTHLTVVTPSSGGGGPSYWPWLIALAAVMGGAAFFIWTRSGRSERYGDTGRMAFAGLAPDAGPTAEPMPPVRPRADPVPPRAQPRPTPTPPAQPRPARSDDGLIVSTRLKPQLDIQFVPERAVISEREVLVQFDVVVVNNGSAPARDVLVEARLVCAHAGQDREIGLFFQNPVGEGDRIAGIPPLGRIALKSAVRMPVEQLHAFEMEGRKLFVPLVAFNILYGGGGQASASFLVGRGSEQDEKLAPFRLDLGPRIFRGLSARPHSMGLAA